MFSENAYLALLLCNLVFWSFVTSLPDSCPKDSQSFHRLGKSRFYIFDQRMEGSGTPTQLGTAWGDQADKLCKSVQKDLHVASYLDLISTNAIIARNMEVVSVKFGLATPSYWINAKFDVASKVYRWKAGGTGGSPPVRYSNFHYQQPRPLGIGGSVTRSFSDDIEPTLGEAHNIQENSQTEQCLAFTLPFRNNAKLGWQTSWKEEDCNISKSHRVLCESSHPACEENRSQDPHVLSEDKEYYFAQGNWIFANRRFIVNYKPRTFDEAKKYCEKYGLQLYSPLLEDECLLPYLKIWANGINAVLSTYQFWTSYKYFQTDTRSEFHDNHGKVMQKVPFQIHKYHLKQEGRIVASETSDITPDKQYCVSFIWSYEHNNETRCKSQNCNWMFWMLAPANCKNPIGTICQHAGKDNTRVCNFQQDWLQNPSLSLKDTAVIEFGYKGSGFWRSTYKQTFGSRLCGHADRQMINDKVEYWKVDPQSVDFLYDFEETYWVVDDGLFQHVGKSDKLCSISIVTFDGGKFSRKVKKVSCNEWHFYICELVT